MRPTGTGQHVMLSAEGGNSKRVYTPAMPAIPPGASLPFDDDPPSPAAIPPGRGPDDSDGFCALGTPVCPTPAAPVRVAPPDPVPLPFPLPLPPSFPLPLPLSLPDPFPFPLPDPFPEGWAPVVWVGFASDPPPAPPFPPPAPGRTYTGESWVEGFPVVVGVGCAIGELAGDFAVEEEVGVTTGRTTGWVSALGDWVVVGGAAGDCVVAGCAAAGVEVVWDVVVLELVVFGQKGESQ